MNNDLLKNLVNGNFDYLDFGCGDGGSMAYISESYPEARGLGIDINNIKISMALEAGHNAIVYDIINLPEQKMVEFVMMSHFLEHLPCLSDARKIIAKAISFAKDFVFIRQPWFDADSALFELGLKFYWSHWRVHPNRMTCFCFYQILENEIKEHRILKYGIYGHTKIVNSSVYSIVPLKAPADSHHYDMQKHGEKKDIDFSFKAYKEVMVLIDIGGMNKAEKLIKSFGQMDTLFISG